MIVKIALLDGTARVWSSSYGRDGQRQAGCMRQVRRSSADADAEAYVARAGARDSDLWVVEFEDKHGRDFLTEEKE